jgi:hypothetical protein
MSLRLPDDSFMEPSFETSGIFDGPPALVIYVTNEPLDKRAKEEDKKVEDLHEVTGTTTRRNKRTNQSSKGKKGQRQMAQSVQEDRQVRGPLW